ncbi:MAG TPA: hypothetical protein VFW00_13845 [Rhodocyclaceae bacterium]|nr:hypothetical protein [Rhodocyclaceae bacterium]
MAIAARTWSQLFVACELPVTQAIAWVCRAKIQEVRNGLIEDMVFTPSWAFGTVSVADDK